MNDLRKSVLRKYRLALKLIEDAEQILADTGLEDDPDFSRKLEKLREELIFLIGREGGLEGKGGSPIDNRSKAEI
jgi:hypothetical protein